MKVINTHPWRCANDQIAPAPGGYRLLCVDCARLVGLEW